LMLFDHTDSKANMSEVKMPFATISK